MKRAMSLAVMFAAVAFAGNALAEGAPMKHVHAAAAKAESKSMTMRGEIVDMGCYVARGAKGEKHKECATKCIAGGMPMGLLTSSGKLYVLTLNHDNPDPFNKLKDMAASTVDVSGTVAMRGGVSTIDVTDVKAADSK